MSRLADASFYIALLHEDDEHHDRAVALADEFAADPAGEIVTSNAIFLEVLAFFSRKGYELRELAAAFVQRQLDSSAVFVVEIDDDLMREGLALYRQRLDQRYSLADCISMIIARTMRITEILTADSDFQAEGFTILLDD